jgi:hypothetical protein
MKAPGSKDQAFFIVQIGAAVVSLLHQSSDVMGNYPNT